MPSAANRPESTERPRRPRGQDLVRLAQASEAGSVAGQGRPGASPPLVVAALLAALAGGVDAIGYLLLGRLFVSYMSGNSTILAIAIERRNWPEALRAGGIIALFVSGTALGALVARLARGWHVPVVLFPVALLLAVAAGWSGDGLPVGALAATVLAMGVLNAALDRAGGIPVGLTYVTGALARFGRGLGDALAGHPGNAGWRKQAVPWIGLMAGAVAGAAAEAAYGRDALWAAAGVALALACCTGAAPRFRGRAGT